MIGSLLLAALALRLGLRMRRARAARRPPPRGMRESHLRLARPAVALLLLGLVGGPISAVWLRGWQPLGTFHAWLGLGAAALFVATAVFGRRLEGGDLSAREAHAALAAFAMLLAAIASMAGFVLLP